ncbi:hypothetical protein DPMN_052181 [Dreissena polymorpha]|uniref:Uncharacterized protein n=1 Tax=Dreissena polymorpha TaxID=45954 RepID=A0A9D4CL87_DREPO|nr:hypothetical protein DPMN_052181 [Dreissena polymorpha]
MMGVKKLTYTIDNQYQIASGQFRVKTDEKNGLVKMKKLKLISQNLALTGMKMFRYQKKRWLSMRQC